MIFYPFIALLLLIAVPLKTTATESELKVVTNQYRVDLQAGDAITATATCAPHSIVVAGGYKVLTSTVRMRSLVIVENQPVPALRQWAVSVLYDPEPKETQTGELTLEASVTCRVFKQDAAPKVSRKHL